MAVHNGEAYLAQQLDSILAQTYETWTLVIGEDQSEDASRSIINEFRSTCAKVELVESKAGNGAENFLSLLRSAENVDYLAFSDQDDVWLPGKLALGVRALQGQEETPTLFCSRTWIVDENLKHPRLSRKLSRPPSFRNALVQNIAAGNTLVLNRKASRLVIEAAQDTGRVVAHDWWIYQLITGAGGNVIVEDQPTLYYRQHGNNYFGENRSLPSRITRLVYALGGRLKGWNDINIAALTSSRHRLTEGHADLLQQFATARKAPFFRRFAALKSLGLYRQRRLESVVVFVLGLFGRL